jgi:hypothetical protein
LPVWLRGERQVLRDAGLPAAARVFGPALRHVHIEVGPRLPEHGDMNRTEGDMCQQLPCAQPYWHQARENRDYVRRLLNEREPVFLALLQSAVCQVDLELARDGQD